MNMVEVIEKEGLREDLPEFNIGDSVDVALRVTEGESERIQVFSGTVIARKGSGIREAFTVRRIVQGEGVERVFPLNSPSIVSIEITRKGRVRRSKLYYLRDRVGKATKVKESRAHFVRKTKSSTVPKVEPQEEVSAEKPGDEDVPEAENSAEESQE